MLAGVLLRCLFDLRLESGRLEAHRATNSAFSPTTV